MKIEKCKKLVGSLYNKKECYAHRKFKTRIKSCISFGKSAYINQIQSHSFAKTIIDMNAELRKSSKLL